MREISIEGAKKVYQAVTYESYMVDDETMVTLFTSPRGLDDIEQQKVNAKEALKLGVPALFSFDVVKVGEQYGVVYEDLHARSLGEQIMADKGNLDHYSELYADFAKRLHSIHVAPGVIPSVKDNQLELVDQMGDLITSEEKGITRSIIAAAPNGDSFLSMMFAPANIRYLDDELYLNDFSRIASGNPFFDVSDTVIALAQSAESDIPESFQYLIFNMDKDTALRLCEGYVRRYYGITSDEQYQQVYQLLRFFGLVKVMLSPASAPKPRRPVQASRRRPRARAALPQRGQAHRPARERVALVQFQRSSRMASPGRAFLPGDGVYWGPWVGFGGRLALVGQRCWSGPG